MDTTGSTNQANVYTPGQQALQQQGANFISSILGGGAVPQQFGLPQVVYDAAFANFNKYQAPMLAAQLGSGSPAINAAMQELQLQLAAQGAKNALPGALDAFKAASNFAFNPIGQTGTSNQLQNTQQQQTSNQVTADIGGLLGALPGFLTSLGGPTIGNI
jgi:hypothetical protein